MRQAFFTLIGFIFYTFLAHGQEAKIKSLVYPQLKTVDVTSIDYTVLLGEKNVPKGFDLDYPKREGKDILVMNDCVEGNCTNGEGVLLYIEKVEPINPNAKNTKELKENVDRFYDEYWKARDKRKKFNTQKYYIPYQDKLMANDGYAITYVVLKGSFSDQGQKFNGEKYAYEVNYNRNGKEFTPEVNLNFSELNKSNLTYGGEMKREYNKTYKYHGLGRNYLLEADPTIDKIVGLFGAGLPKMISITYAPDQELKSFLGIPSERFYKEEKDVYTDLKGNYIFGRISFGNGLEYIGGMLDDTYNGIGKLTNPDGSIEQGLWVKGKLHMEKEVTFPEVLLTEDFTKLPYKTIKLKDEVYDSYDDYFYFGNLLQNKPSGLGMYMNTTDDLLCFVGEIFNQIPGSNYFYFNDFQDKFKSGIQIDKNRWLGIAYSAGFNKDVASGYFKVGDMAALNNFEDVNTALPNITYSNTCIKILPNNDNEKIGYFQFPEGWYSSVTGKKYFAKLFRMRWGFYDDTDETRFSAEKEVRDAMVTNNNFCSTDFSNEDKQKIIQHQIDLLKAEKERKEYYADLAAKTEAAEKAFNDCWKPQIVMSSNPAQTYTFCNDHKTYGERKPISQVKYGDVVQHSGAMYQVISVAYGRIVLSCGFEVTDSHYYVFDKLKKAKDELREYCDCSGYDYVTRSYQVPNGRQSVVYQSSTVTFVKNHTDTKSMTYRVKKDCSKACGGVRCWPSSYAKGN